eukprot:327669_1
MSKAMIDFGLKDLGYIFINVDDGWMTHNRSSNGTLQWDPIKYPHGIPYLTQQLHSKGFLFGLYADAGWQTCGRFPGSMNREYIDILTFAQWGCDYIKIDNCYPDIHRDNDYVLDEEETAIEQCLVQKPSEYERYTKFGNALRNVSFIRNMTWEMCLYGFNDVSNWGASIAGGHLWRTTGDIKARWKNIALKLDANDAQRFTQAQGPNNYWAWNYPDSLEVGHDSLTLIEQKTHFTMWAVIKSPLLLDFDLRILYNNSQETNYVLDIITNKDIININQDALGIQATCLIRCANMAEASPGNPYFERSMQLWQGPLANNKFVVVILNRWNETKVNYTLNWNSYAHIPFGKYNVYDLWEHKIIDTITSPSWYIVDYTFQAHDSVALRLDPL